MSSPLKIILKLESAPNIVFIAMLLLAIVAENSPFAPYYHTLHSATATLVINDGLMAIFFLCVGIEIKQEIKQNSAAPVSQLLLPVTAALGGIIIPALIFSFGNWGTATMRGWAIPTATDIAFSLGVLSLFGKSVPPALRIFLMSIAVFDDLVAIVIIAIFYTQDIQWVSLAFSCGCVVLLAIYNRYVNRMPAFIFAGCALWVALLDSGINPTIAGAIFGVLMPLDMGKRVLHFLHIWVVLLFVPIFVFANSGVPLGLLYMSVVANPLSLGIAGGLFFGKQCGIFALSALLIRAGWAKLPIGTTWLQLYAVSILCGIGFTMSLFIGSLAFTSEPFMLFEKAGILMGSLASAAVGIICMALSQHYNKAKT